MQTKENTIKEKIGHLAVAAGLAVAGWAVSGETEYALWIYAFLATVVSIGAFVDYEDQKKLGK